MNVALNGTVTDLADGATVAGALACLGVAEAGRGVAVAVQGEVVPRGRWESTELREGDRVEVVAAIGGG